MRLHLLLVVGGDDQVPSATVPDATMARSPRQFSALLNKAIAKKLLPLSQEKTASSRAVATVMHAVHAAAAAGQIQYQGQAVDVDRIIVAGSYGKKTNVLGQFDVDVVAFFNPPTAGSVAMNDPDTVQQQLQPTLSQLESFLKVELLYLLDWDEVKEMQWQLDSDPCRLAIELELHIALAADGGSTSNSHVVKVDLVLAPNLAAGDARNKGKAQAAAVLEPMLAALDNSQGSSSSRRGGCPLPSRVRSAWLAESATSFFMTAAANDTKFTGRVVTDAIRLLKAWVRQGLQQAANNSNSSWTREYGKLKGFMLELVVMHAASKPGAADDGHEVVHLFMKTLLVIQELSQSAAASACGGMIPPILFTHLPSAVFYKRQQALQLQKLVQTTSPSKAWDSCKGQPVVVHPVDPLYNVFDQQPDRRLFQLWQQLGEAALRLQTDLQERNWGYITSKSSLAAVFAG
jgi:hypothetical protein